ANAFLTAVHAALKNEPGPIDKDSIMSPGTMKTSIQMDKGDAAEPKLANLNGLTAREIQVLKIVADGHSTKQIAKMLGISFKTAACHRSRLLAKAGVHESVSLLRWAIRQGIVNP